MEAVRTLMESKGLVGKKETNVTFAKLAVRQNSVRNHCLHGCAL